MHSFGVQHIFSFFRKRKKESKENKGGKTLASEEQLQIKKGVKIENQTEEM